MDKKNYATYVVVACFIVVSILFLFIFEIVSYKTSYAFQAKNQNLIAYRYSGRNIVTSSERESTDSHSFQDGERSSREGNEPRSDQMEYDEYRELVNEMNMTNLIHAIQSICEIRPTVSWQIPDEAIDIERLVIKKEAPESIDSPTPVSHSSVSGTDSDGHFEFDDEDF
ncbi:hypothetical protein IKE97_00790 [Candidatus Saccharibacteria bacterium]|nr:hypothetical protein [Candidatus Saccharibacteria bacterium]